MSYCDYCLNLPAENPHKIYHDFHYGFPIEDDKELFGRFILEIFQAGLSWDIILKKQEAFRQAFGGFDIQTIAGFQESDVETLVQNPDIIRNRRKIEATIHNAQVILKLQKDQGSFKNWLDQHHPLSLEEWIALFKKTFKFTGREIVNEFLMSTGYLPGAHDESCRIFQQLKDL